MDLVATLRHIGLNVVVIDEKTFPVRPEEDIELVGCLTVDELYNGSSARRASKPVHVKTLLEDRGIVDEEHPDEHTDDFCFISDLWLSGDTPVLWEQIAALMPVGRKRNRGGIIELRLRYAEFYLKYRVEA